MLDSADELVEKIGLGEDTFLEYKQVLFAGKRMTAPNRKAVADGMAAFANSRGGVFVLGVEDKQREIVGIALDRLDDAERLVREVCRDAIDPPLAPTIERLYLPGANGDKVAVIKIEVPRSLFVHQSPGGYLHRVGGEKRRMSPDYLARMFQQRSQARLIRFDEQVVADATLDDLTSPLWERFRSLYTGDEREEVLAKLHMANHYGDGALKPTVAGVLMAAADPRTWLPNAFIQAVAYRGAFVRAGTSDPYQLDAADLCGPLDQQVAGACSFVAKNMKVAAFKTLGRRDVPQFDMAAVFEAVVNAVAHRDYSIHGSKIRLRLFENRLEIYSPGALPNTIGVDELPLLQATRNEVLTSLLGRCPVPTNVPGLETHRQMLMDKRGDGVPIILERSIELSGKKPEYELIGGAELRLTIFAADAHAEAHEM